MRRISLPLALCLAAHTPARSEVPSPWRAIGQIVQGEAKPGGAICTGALVAPDLVLTAGHCLRRTSEEAIHAVRFAAGWQHGRAIATRQGEAIIRSGQDGLEGDLALLVLDTPIPPDLVPSLAVGSAVRAGTPLRLLAYRRDAPDTLTTTDACRIVTVKPNLLGLDCPVVSGNSGAPLLVLRDGRWQIIGVLVAQMRTPGPVRALAVIPDPVLAARIDAR